MFGAAKLGADLRPIAFGRHRSLRVAVGVGQHRQTPESQAGFRDRHAAQRGEQPERQAGFAQPIAADFLKHRQRRSLRHQVENIRVFENFPNVLAAKPGQLRRGNGPEVQTVEFVRLLLKAGQARHSHGGGTNG